MNARTAWLVVALASGSAAFAAESSPVTSVPGREDSAAMDHAPLSKKSAPTDSIPRKDRDSTAADILELREKSVKSATTQTHREKEVSRIRLGREDLKNIAAAQGDPMRALSALPGTSNQNDMSVRPFVRGGKSEETQVLWEGIPLLQPYHFGSLYSVFNIESLQDLTLYSGGFPVEMGNALSGALYMRARPAPLDTMALSADLSMLRGNAYAGVPLWKDKLGISLAYQAFWYDWVFNRGLDVASLLKNDPSFDRNRRQIQNYVDLPNFKDLQLGLSWKFSERLKGEYTGLLSKDIFTILEPHSHQYVNDQEVSPDYYLWDLLYGKASDVREKTREADTLAAVSINNDVHAVAFHWKPTAVWNVDAATAYQSQEWSVGFFDNVIWNDSVTPDGRFAGYRTVGPSDFRLKIRNRTYDWRLDANGYVRDDFRVRLGASQSVRESDFETSLPRPIFETVVNGNVDAMDALGYFNPDGMLIRKTDPGANPEGDYANSLPRLVKFEQKGTLSASFLAAYLSGEYSFDDAHRLTLGVRAESDTYSDKPFLSPRAAYFQSLGENDELTFASGLYSQSDFPFQIRNANVSLEPEKAFHFNAEWTHAFSRRYRLECEFYQKNYFDLVVPYLVNTGHLNWQTEPLKLSDSAAFELMNPAQKDSVVERFGDRSLGYRNGGTGKAAGAEIAFFYDPGKSWGGWFSAEAGYSKRQDDPGGRSYDFRYGRPWAFNWINHFKLPNRFGLALRGRYAAGLPYTDYVDYGDGGGKIGSGFATTPADPENDTLFYSGPRNGKRYSAYSRWDIRLSREFPAWGRKMEAYFELWNAFNTPNFLMTDSKTEQWKFVDLNYPIPILFLGLSGRW
ncbi:MAG: TonB family protein [Fibrobacteres bacterium]|nr:TonB family protein [Fibrobacterota bacterium]